MPGRPDPSLDDRPPLDLRRLLAAPWPVEVVPEAGSTNSVLVERARAAGAEPQVLVAEHQVAGRGRRDRTWTAAARAGLTFSVLLRPDVEPARWSWLPLLAGCAVGEVLAGLAPAAGWVRLKWPNDVLAGDRKLAGILVERVDPSSGPAAVVGIGLNVSTTEAELPVPGATSLLLEGVRVDRTGLLLALLTRMAERYDVWAGARTPSAAALVDAELRTAYAAACATVGRRVLVELPGRERLAGRATGVDQSGRLLVATEQPAGSAARVVAVAAGDVAHVREDG